MFEPERDKNVGWRRVQNEELDSFCLSSYIDRVIYLEELNGQSIQPQWKTLGVFLNFSI